MENIFKGKRVLELASVLAGPSVGMFMAELGAEVIKVENKRLGGDVTRGWKLTSEDPQEDRSAYFCSVNWGKKSIALDLAEEEELELLYGLAELSDIVISSFVPGKAEKLGVSSQQLQKRNPRLICAEVNGYGQDRSKAAYDAIIQGEAGFTYMNGLEKDIFKMPVALMDVLAAHQLKEALLLAYIHLLQTGEGKIVRVSLLESGVASLVNQANNWLQAGQIPVAKGSDHPNIVPYGSIFQTRDGKGLILAVGNDGQFERLCQILDVQRRKEWATNVGRVGDRDKIKKLIGEKIALFERDDLLNRLDQMQVPAGAIHSMKEVFDMEIASNMVYANDKYRGVKSAVFLPQTQGILPPPSFNQHESEIRSLVQKSIR